MVLTAGYWLWTLFYSAAYHWRHWRTADHSGHLWVFPAFLPSPADTSCSPAFTVSWCLISPQLDILVTEASTHFPRLKGGSLSLPGTPPLSLAGPSATSFIIHAVTDVHNADLFMWSGWWDGAKQAVFSPALSPSSSALYILSVFCSKPRRVATEEDRIQSWKHRIYRRPRGYQASPGWLH